MKTKVLIPISIIFVIASILLNYFLFKANIPLKKEFIWFIFTITFSLIFLSFVWKYYYQFFTKEGRYLKRIKIFTFISFCFLELIAMSMIIYSYFSNDKYLKIILIVLIDSSLSFVLLLMFYSNNFELNPDYKMFLCKLYWFQKSPLIKEFSNIKFEDILKNIVIPTKNTDKSIQNIIKNHRIIYKEGINFLDSLKIIENIQNINKIKIDFLKNIYFFENKIQITKIINMNWKTLMLWESSNPDALDKILFNYKLQISMFKSIDFNKEKNINFKSLFLSKLLNTINAIMMASQIYQENNNFDILYSEILQAIKIFNSVESLENIIKKILLKILEDNEYNHSFLNAIFSYKKNLYDSLLKFHIESISI